MGLDDEEQDDVLAPMPTDVLHPDEQKALQIQDENVVDSARIGSKVFVSIKNVCAFFGLQAQRQTTRIREHAILSQGIRLIALKTRGGIQNTLCLDAEMIPTWLVILQPKRAKPEFQQLISEYQSRMTQAIRDVYFIQALATNPRHAHLAGILENLFAEVHKIAQDGDEMQFAMSVLLDFVAEQHGGRPLTLAANAAPIEGGRGLLRIIPAIAQGSEEAEHPHPGPFTLVDRVWENGELVIHFGAVGGGFLLADTNGAQMGVNPDQALHLLRLLQERRGQLLQQYHDATSQREKREK